MKPMSICALILVISIVLGIFLIYALIRNCPPVVSPKPVLTLTVIAPTGEIIRKQASSDGLNVRIEGDLQAAANATGREITLWLFDGPRGVNVLARRDFTGVGGSVSGRGYTVVADWELRP